MLLKHFRRAMGKRRNPAEPERMVTSGVERDTLVGEVYLFAQALRRADGAYDIQVMENNSPILDTETRSEGLSLREALETLDVWERAKMHAERSYTVDGADNVPNFRDVAARHGIVLGPEGVSLRHSTFAKRIVIARQKQAAH